MGIDRGELAQLLASGTLTEDSQFEAKQAGGNIPGSVWETISAFANTDGGAIVLGLRESEDRCSLEPAGVSNARQRMQELANHLRDPRKISVEAVRPDDFWIETVDGKDFIIINVDQAPRRDRPVYIHNNRELAYVRRIEGDSRCNHVEIDRMRREATRDGQDRQVVEFLSWEDFDQESIAYYRSLAEDNNPDLPHLHLENRAFLTRIDAWRRDRESGNEGPTLAGILMFGTEEAIREIRPNHVIDYRRIPSTESATRRWTDRYRSSANLLETWREIFPRLLRGLPRPFRLVGEHRQDRPFGRDSLREAFANLLVHTDYDESGDAVVFHYDDSYFFRNPGDSWVSVDAISTEGRTSRRNSTIANLFALVGLADQAGSGFTRIFSEWSSSGFRKPIVVSDPVAYEFSLTLSLASLLPSADREWLRELGGPWTETEEIALTYALHNGEVDNQLLRNAAGVDMIEASRTLTNLRDQRILYSTGSGRAVRYRLMDSAQQESNSIDNHTRSGIKQTNSIDKDVNQQSSTQVSDQLQLEKIAAPVAQSVRARPEIVRRTILQLCETEPRSLAFLTILMNRNQQTLRPHIRALFDLGILLPTHAQVNHPQQSYKAVPNWRDDFPEE